MAPNSAAVAVVLSRLRRLMPLLKVVFMNSSLCCGRSDLGNKKTPLGDLRLREGGIPDCKTLATSMSFANAYRAFVLLRSPLTGAIHVMQSSCQFGSEKLWP
jgi:hypothetical protein